MVRNWGGASSCNRRGEAIWLEVVTLWETQRGCIRASLRQLPGLSEDRAATLWHRFQL